MKKRVLSLILALALCVGLLPAPAGAETVQAGQTQSLENTGNPEKAGASESGADVENAGTPEDGGNVENAGNPENGGNIENAGTPESGGNIENAGTPENGEEGENPENPQADEAVQHVQALLDQLPSPEEMSEAYIDALEIAYDAYLSLTAEQQGRIAGADRFEALFAWVNGQVDTLADNEAGWTESGNTVTLENYSGSKQLYLTQDTVLVLNGTNKIECGFPIRLNGKTLTIRGEGSLELTATADNSYIYGAIGDNASYTGTLILESGTVTAKATHCSGVVAAKVEVRGGKLDASGGDRGNGIATNNLIVSGENAVVCARAPYDAAICGIDRFQMNSSLSLLYSDNADAGEDDMQTGDSSELEAHKTICITKSTKPVLSVGAQTGELYPNTAGTATFALSGRNVDLNTVTASWEENAPTGITVSVENSTLTVTADETVQQGAYPLTLTATGTYGAAAKTVNVVVSGVPLTITNQPENNVTGQVNQADFDSVSIEVTPSRNDQITYQWKLADGTVLDGETTSKLFLKDIPEDKREQDSGAEWKKTARVYCTVTYNNRYSVNSETVTVIFSTCEHEGHYSPEGKCQQCGYQIPKNDATKTWIHAGRAYGDDKYISNLIRDSEDKTVYLLRDINTLVDGLLEEADIDLNGHTVGSLSVEKFLNTTIRNGTVTNLVFPMADENYSGENRNIGTITLVGITVTGETKIGSGTTVTIGENCVFKEQADIQGETRLTGGTFEKGIKITDNNYQHLLDILADGYAYAQNGKVCDYSKATAAVSVDPHDCTFLFGKCEACGRVCQHPAMDENGVCKTCGLMAKPFAIGETRYATLAEAVDAAGDGDTVTMGSDARLSQTLTVSKDVTLDLGGHTLAEECGETEQKAPLSIAGTVTIRNGKIENLYTAKPTGAVGVVTNGNLTVERAELKGSESDASAGDAVSVSGGHMTLATGTVYGIFVESGGLTVTGGAVSWLGAGIEAGSIRLSGGTVGRFDGKTGSENAKVVREMLAPYYAYADIHGKLYTLNQAVGNLPYWQVSIVECSHPAGISETEECQYCGQTCNHPQYENGVCTTCGAVCTHPGVTESGGTYTCSTCGEQMAVKVTHGETVSYYPQEKNSEGADATLYDIIAGLQNDSTVTLLMDGIRLFATINNGNTVTLDLNEKQTVESTNGIELFNNSTLKVAGTGSFTANGSSSYAFRMLSGKLDLSGWTGEGTIGSVYADAGELVPPPKGKITRLDVNENPENPTGPYLYGGRYGRVIQYVGWRGYSAPVGHFLTGGYAFQKADGSFVSYTQEITSNKGIENVAVVLCPHELPDDFSGRTCPYCNTYLAALVETDAGMKGYAAAQYAVDNAQGGMVVLLIDLEGNAGTLTVSAACTLDFNGHTVKKLVVKNDVTLESLLPKGQVYKAEGQWISAPSGTELTNVTAERPPFENLRAENANVTVTYGESATLKALVTAYGKTPTMQWSQKVGESFTPLSGETQDTLTLSGLNVGNYVYRFTYTVDGYSKSVDFAVTVNKAQARIVVAPTAKELVYNGTAQELLNPGTAEGGALWYSIGNLPSSENVPKRTDANTYKIEYGITPDSNHEAQGGAIGSVEVKISKVSAEELKITLLNGPFTYDGTEKAMGVKVMLGDVDITGQIHICDNTGTHAGDYSIRMSSGNIENVGGIKVKWEIAPKEIQSAGVTLGPALCYTGETQTQNIQSVKDGDADVTYTVGGNIGKNAGDYTMVLTFIGDYTGTMEVPWTIGKAPLEITADRKNVAYGDPTPTYTATYAGFQNGETADVLGGTLTFSCDYTPTSKANGSYTITPGGLTSQNYEIKFTDSTVSVSPRTITVTWNNTALTYNGANQAPTATAGNTVNGDMLTLTVQGTGKDAGSYTAKVTGITGDNAKNYVLPTQVSTGFAIGKKSVTITGTAVRSAKEYDGNANAEITAIGSIEGNLDGKNLTVIPGTARYSDKNVKNGKLVSFAGFALSGSAAENYTLSGQPESVTADITAKPVTVQVSVRDKDFDGAAEAAVESAALTGVLDGDAVSVQAGKAAFAHAAPGTWEVTLEKLSLTGKDAGNYSLTNPRPTGLTAAIRANEHYLDLSDTLPGVTEVSIDGKKQTVSDDGGTFLNLPEDADILTTYETNGSYPTGMRVYRVIRDETGSKLEEIPELQNLLQYAGCSIRLTGTKGIRMITALDETVKAALTGKGLAGFTLEEYGTVVAKKSSLGDMDLTLETGKHNYAYKKGVSDPVFDTAGGTTQYTNVLVGFSLEDCKEELVMRPYILLRDENGELRTVYGGIVTRSIGYIAKQNENTYRPGTDGYRFIHEIIEAVYGKG